MLNANVIYRDSARPDAALAYAAKGWQVFPIPVGTKKSHKSAEHSNGQRWGATRDPDEIGGDFTRWPNANIGIATGAESGIFVVEVDTPEGHDVDGPASLRELESQHGNLPDTLTAESPSGSVHYYFRYPTGIEVRNSTSVIAPGIDVRGEGGMVVAPPSIKPSVGVYHWKELAPVAEAPAWLIELVKKKPHHEEPASPNGNPAGLDSPYARAALERECEAVATAARGTRNDRLNTAAFSLFQLVAGGELDEYEVRNGLTEASLAAGLERGEIRATIDSGAREGRKKPRVTPQQEQENVTNSTGASHLPGLHVGEPTETAEHLAALIAASGRVFENGYEPVRVIVTEDRMPRAVSLDANYVRVLGRRLCRPVKRDRNGNEVEATITPDVASIYLSLLEDHWGLRPLRGITTCPILGEGGGIRTASGYDEASGLWCHSVPEVGVPHRPTRKDAEGALGLLRRAFRTFPFADATMRAENGVMVVDDTQPIGMDESSFLAALMTSVCRSSLLLAPGFLANAPFISGAGIGKGLLVRATCVIASGVAPSAFTSGHDEGEFDKRLTAALIEAQPCVFLDNFNAKTLCSDILASALTENPMKVRVLGQTKNVPLHTATFIAISGNGVQVAEDMARRLLITNLDARTDDPEQRRFEGSLLEDVHTRRGQLLSAVLTIWRWGQMSADIMRGRPIGSYETWAKWVRDPLLALGCRDVVERVREVKAADPRRREIAEVFEAWWDEHGHKEVKASDLCDEVKRLLDPHALTVEDGKDESGEPRYRVKANRQRVAGWLQRHKGTQVAGYRLEEVRDPHHKRSVATYRLVNVVLGGNGFAVNDNTAPTSTSTSTEDVLAWFARG